MASISGTASYDSASGEIVVDYTVSGVTVQPNYETFVWGDNRSTGVHFEMLRFPAQQGGQLRFTPPAGDGTYYLSMAVGWVGSDSQVRWVTDASNLMTVTAATYVPTLTYIDASMNWRSDTSVNVVYALTDQTGMAYKPKSDVIVKLYKVGEGPFGQRSGGLNSEGNIIFEFLSPGTYYAEVTADGVTEATPELSLPQYSPPVSTEPAPAPEPVPELPPEPTTPPDYGYGNNLPAAPAAIGTGVIVGGGLLLLAFTKTGKRLLRRILH